MLNKIIINFDSKMRFCGVIWSSYIKNLGVSETIIAGKALSDKNHNDYFFKFHKSIISFKYFTYCFYKILGHKGLNILVVK